jgi:hypothetical protein
MQLKPADWRAALAGAAASLLAPVAPITAHAAVPGEGGTPWLVDSAVLLYQEGGGRVKALEPVLNLRRTDRAGVSTGLKLTLDSLTGASPNGAVAQPGVQTFTSPSGRASYEAPSGRVPLDPSFKDTRVALAANQERPWGSAQRLSYGVNFSHEYDFTSLGANVSLARDFDRKNTTLSLGLAFEADQLRPVGGQPAPLKPMFGAGSAKTGKGTRQVGDLLLGWTQVVNRQWLMQLNLGLGSGSGEHTDPYKLLSVVDGGTGLVTGSGYVAESRPDRRTRTSLFWAHKLSLGPGVLDASYRWYGDSWGVRSHTWDLRWRHPLPGGGFVQPRWRHHVQSAADFHRGWLVEGVDWNSATQRSPLTHASADTRLGGFTADTVGVTLGWPLAREQLVTLRLESYRQRQDALANPPGVLATLPTTADLKATVLTAGWSFRW